MSNHYAEHSLNIIKGFLDFPLPKFFLGFFALLYGLFFDINLGKYMFVLITLILFDFISGVLASLKNGEVIESRKLIKTAIKILLYFFAVATVHLITDIVSLPDGGELATVSLLIATEFLSILENLKKGKVPLPISIQKILK